MCFFNRGDTEGNNSSKMLCPMFVCVLFYVKICVMTDLWLTDNLWFDDLREESMGDELNMM